MAHTWAAHWDAIADQSSRGKTVEAELMEYHQSIRVAFTTSEMPEILMTVMPPYVRSSHQHIMALPVEQREALVVWHFGDESERRAAFDSSGKEPSRMGAIYRKLGRRGRQARANKNN